MADQTNQTVADVLKSLNDYVTTISGNFTDLDKSISDLQAAQVTLTENHSFVSACLDSLSAGTGSETRRRSNLSSPNL